MAEGGSINSGISGKVLLEAGVTIDNGPAVDSGEDPIITSDNLVVDQSCFMNLAAIFNRLPGSIVQEVRLEIAEFLANDKNEDLRSMIDLDNPDRDSNISLMVEFSQADVDIRNNRRGETLDLALASTGLSLTSAMDL